MTPFIKYWKVTFLVNLVVYLTSCAVVYTLLATDLFRNATHAVTLCAFAAVLVYHIRWTVTLSFLVSDEASETAQILTTILDNLPDTVLLVSETAKGKAFSTAPVTAGTGAAAG